MWVTLNIHVQSVMRRTDIGSSAADFWSASEQSRVSKGEQRLRIFTLSLAKFDGLGESTSFLKIQSAPYRVLNLFHPIDRCGLVSLHFSGVLQHKKIEESNNFKAIMC